MLDLSDVPASARLYLQPTGFCGPQLGQPDTTVQIAGLPVWATAFRIIARGYEGRASDTICTLKELEAGFSGPRGGELERLFSAATRGSDQWSFSDSSLIFNQPRLMAVLNITPDSFSDGGDHIDHAQALKVGFEYSKAGADILDVGGESTRPGATTVWEGDELERVLPVIEGLRAAGAAISIDTRKAAVMRAALDAGAGIVNDVSALRFDEGSLDEMTGHDCPIILMHAQGNPETMQHAPRYEDVVLDVYDALESRIEDCESAGIERSRLAIDPGIGFGKSVQHNLALINNLAVFHGLGCPIVLGVSRKRFIGALADVEEPKARFPGSMAAALKALSQGVHILRVHDVKETRQALDIWRGLADEMQMPPALI